MAKAKKTCFVICPIGHEGSQERQRSDKILRHIIRPVADQHGYDAIRADGISLPGLITKQVIRSLLDADLVIADLTGHNANVFYELAIRHAKRKPVIQIIEKGESIPFDLGQTRTIFLDHRDMDSVEVCRQRIGEQIEAIEKSPEASDNLIGDVVDEQFFKTSEKPIEKSVARLSEKIEALTDVVQRVAGERSSSVRISQQFGIPLVSGSCVSDPSVSQQWPQVLRVEDPLPGGPRITGAPGPWELRP